MRSLRVILAVILLFVGGIASSHAAVRSYNKLSMSEQLALEESERRLASYDQELVSLDQSRSKHHISKAYYETENQQLTLLIREETLYQNAILVRDPHLGERAEALFETMQHAVLAVPVGIGYVIGACPQLLQLLTLIH